MFISVLSWLIFAFSSVLRIVSSALGISVVPSKTTLAASSRYGSRVAKAERSSRVCGPLPGE
ncbi:hypothetical protein [Natronosalvus rutilus]|uniref:Uncharacterized protein n=1 Tax=Natronosalvus rutilus TaxID=2953753 RepID=A0A9E7N618_9EURY|nr:hypothetical protein [Natronosalvus rutilus]UTF52215.1 hypothetical protein NGM29_10435 [Natronosalvus rutilus]